MNILNDFWNTIRYRGDKQDIEELHKVYVVDDYLKAYEDNKKKQECSARAKFMAHGVRLTSKLSPRVFNICQTVFTNLGINVDVEVFSIPSPGMNAFALQDITSDGNHLIVGLRPKTHHLKIL